jgi:putative toxin-antitoxin system antitoxin component (TIGR02293 family)
MPALTHLNDKLSISSRFKNLGLHNDFALVLRARKGVKTKLFYDFAEAIKMPEKSLAGIINLSARTLSNYKAQQKVLEPVYSEHLLKLINLFEKGESIFGNIDEFNYWLQKPIWGAKDTPIDWLETPGGVDLVAAEIDKLSQGYPV